MAAAKKVAKKKRPPAAAAARKAAKKPAAKSRTKKVPRAAAKKSRAAARKRPAGLGRVKVSADARLDLVFQKDYQAREIFEFLKVQTLRELEQHGPDEIIERLTAPMVQTVQRIRKTLAMINRHLSRDEKFAKAFLAEVASG
jgi:rhamnose utilization protein RhaD (predicted bifunctional aldolase and dehydrogenase)